MSAIANAAYGLGLLVVGAVVTFLTDHAVARAQHKPVAAIPVRARNFLREFLTSDPGNEWKDKVLFYGATPLALAAVATGLTVIPIGPLFAHQPMPQLTVGVFFYLVILDFMAVALYCAGWGANNSAGSHGAFLAVAQFVSYLVPLGLAVTDTIMAAQSLRATEVVNAQAQTLWYGVWQPYGLAIYLLAVFGQTYRPPANLPIRGEAMNVSAEYVGTGVAGLKLALYAIWFAAAAMGTVLFLGGWQGPWLPGPVWFFIKTIALLALMSWFGTKVQPLSLERMVRFAWIVLIPASIASVVLVGLTIAIAGWWR